MHRHDQKNESAPVSKPTHLARVRLPNLELRKFTARRSTSGQSFAIPSTAQSTVDLLQRRFGNKTVVQRAHINELTNVKPVFNPKITRLLRWFFNTAIENNYRLTGSTSPWADLRRESCTVCFEQTIWLTRGSATNDNERPEISWLVAGSKSLLKHYWQKLNWEGATSWQQEMMIMKRSREASLLSLVKVEYIASWSRRNRHVFTTPC